MACFPSELFVTYYIILLLLCIKLWLRNRDKREPISLSDAFFLNASHQEIPTNTCTNFSSTKSIKRYHIIICLTLPWLNHHSPRLFFSHFQHLISCTAVLKMPQVKVWSWILEIPRRPAESHTVLSWETGRDQCGWNSSNWTISWKNHGWMNKAKHWSILWMWGPTSKSINIDTSYWRRLLERLVSGWGQESSYKLSVLNLVAMRFGINGSREGISNQIRWLWLICEVDQVIGVWL